MVARHFVLRHGDEEFALDYDTGDGLEVLKFQIFSLTSVLPDDQKIVVEEGEIVLTEASDLEAVSDKLRLVSLLEEQASASKSVEMSDEELARMLQAEEDHLALQMLQAEADGRELEERVRPTLSQVLMYEDPRRQEAARETVPVDELEETALVWLAKDGTFDPSKDEKDHAFLLQLLFWFKQSFSWVNAPPCDDCGGETNCYGMGAPLPSESRHGCSRVELYRCTRKCLRTTRFPRYNDPSKLLETRRGRCGEWANCFTLYCRAFGYESRLILDFTDHLWTECFLQFHGRWMHLDPCEGAFDNPLLYEKGWNKKLNYVIAISKDGVHDVTKRYTKRWHEVLSRRNITTESAAAAVLSKLTRERRNSYSLELLAKLQHRDKNEADELETIHLQNDTSPSLPGRQSGSKEWRMARLEIGSGGNNPLSNSSCPVRICMDDHVRNICNSFSHLLSHFFKNKLPKSEVVKNLEILKRLFVNLKSSSFKMRQAFINPTDSHMFKEETFPSIYEVLSAVSLKREPDSGEKIFITLAGNPVQTSIALPMALDTLDEIIDHLDRTIHFDQCFLINFSRLNRISSGSVLASGEQLPSGIATAAFDGDRLSKWEEPNGARGCWLIYQTKDAQMHALEEYELMSANDVPERDPMDWILEGSEDGGSSWNILDQQASQIFEKRFQRKRFKVKSGQKSNIFRFKFLKVRDSKAQPRFQIGSIDLYAVES